MSLFFISDIHGSMHWLQKALEKFEEEKAEHMVLLGDVLYHGPRNPLPDGYDPKAVAAALNGCKEKILAIRGNCDAEVDQMMLEFPIMAEYGAIFYEGIRIYAVHGHKIDEDTFAQLSPGDVLIHGHTHVLKAEQIEGKYIVNPGSISLPKENNPNTYGVLQEREFRIKDFDGNIIKQIKV